jgi:hypothetical protein
MSCPPLLRRLVACAFCLAGLVVPATELVHGFAHHEASHHRDHAGAAAGNAVTPAGHHGDHPHGEIGLALTVRLDGIHTAAALTRGIHLAEHAIVQRPAAPVEAGDRRWTSTHAPPPGARAPPSA